MQNYTTIVAVLTLKEKGCTNRKMRSRYKLGASTVTHILKRQEELGIAFIDLKQMWPSKVEEAFYPSEKSRRK